RNICAGHGSCARLLAADGPKLGQGRRPDLGIGAQDERLAAELDRAQFAGAYLLIRRLTADPVSITKVFERQSRSVHFQFASCLLRWSRICPLMPSKLEFMVRQKVFGKLCEVQCTRIFRSSLRAAS